MWKKKIICLSMGLSLAAFTVHARVRSAWVYYINVIKLKVKWMGFWSCPDFYSSHVLLQPEERYWLLRRRFQHLKWLPFKCSEWEQVYLIFNHESMSLLHQLHTWRSLSFPSWQLDMTACMLSVYSVRRRHESFPVPLRPIILHKALVNRCNLCT